MAERTLEAVVSGPDSKGQWHWRPLDGAGGTQPLQSDLVSPLWESGEIVELRLKRNTGIWQVVEIAGPAIEPEALLLLNGEPVEFGPDDRLHPGTVVIAEIPFGNPGDGGDPSRTSKRRPTVVASVGDGFVSVRAVYSRNTEGRGTRLLDPEAAGLKPGAVIAHDETHVPLLEVSRPTGVLAEADRRRLRI